jgi:hypothetical protein
VAHHLKYFCHLQIEVLLPHLKERREGMLLQYNLHYNVALVTVKNFHAARPVILGHDWLDRSRDNILAIGCCFNSGTLMAASEIALVTVKNFHAARPVILGHDWLDRSRDNILLAIGCCFNSGTLMAASEKPTGKLDCKFLAYSISCVQAGIGGPLFFLAER